jgi:hypothetical protein
MSAHPFGSSSLARHLICDCTEAQACQELKGISVDLKTRAITFLQGPRTIKINSKLGIICPVSAREDIAGWEAMSNPADLPAILEQSEHVPDFQ